MLLSIVLTVYNKEEYLSRAFDALLSQAGVLDSEYEILVVNDGSTDKSASIIEGIASQDKRVRVITQTNQGLSMARNNGAEAAFGEYVWFVDADDVISTNAVRLINEAAKSRPDLIPIYAETEGVERVRNQVPPEAKSGKDIILSQKWELCGVFNVFRRSFLREFGLRFMPGIYHEDAEFTPRALYSAKTVKVIPEVLYKVYRDPAGITQVPRSKRAFDYLTVSESLAFFVQDKGEVGSPVGGVIDEYTARDINNAFAIIIKNSLKEQEELNALFYFKREPFLRVLRSTSHFKYRLEGFLFNLFPRHCVKIYKIMKFIG